MLIILLTVLIQNKRPCVLFMDEPEVSLHVEWQQRLLDILTDLNEDLAADAAILKEQPLQEKSRKPL